mmetsp:Transcript_36308/g.56732  ORF Transcript_36308/g.56732 Transcript_36308/m.56732 type:complete len:151 (-) Transcript_36308:1275-1727(-)
MKETATKIKGIVTVMEQPDKEGRVILMSQIKRINFAELTYEKWKSWIRYFLIVFHCLIFDEDGRKEGVVFVNDYDGLPFFQLLSLQGKVDKDVQSSVQSLMMGAMPLKMKGFYLVNAPWWIEVPAKIILPFLSKKLRERVFFVSKRWRKV